MEQRLPRRRGRMRPRILFREILTLLPTLLLISVAEAQNDPPPCSADQQPVVTSVSPPSGTTQTEYTISGENLNQTRNISLTQDSENILGAVTVTNASEISFTVDGDADVITAAATLLLVPDQEGCANVSVELFIVRRGIFVSFLSGARADAQPGTVVTTAPVNSCLPPDCGDNSTDYSVLVAGQELQTISADELSFVARFPDTDTSFSDAVLYIQTFYSLLATTASVDYRVPPPISSISPSSGQQGTRVVIQGENLFGVGDGVITLKQVLVGSSVADIEDMPASNTTHIYARINSGIVNSTSIMINTTQTISGDDYDGPYTYANDLWVQLEDGVVTELVPPAVQGGNILQVCGERLLGGGRNITNISIAGQNVVTFDDVVPNPNPGGAPECIEAMVPDIPNPENVPSGGIRIEADTGAIIESPSNITFTYATVTNVSPAQGQVGTEVTITGIQLLSGYSDLQPTVYLSNVGAVVVSATADTVIVRAEDPGNVMYSGSGESPSSDIINVAGDVVIVVTRDNQDYNVSLPKSWTYLEAGEIEEVEPAFGQSGTRITLSGTNLLGNGSNLRQALIGGAMAMIVSRNSTVVVLEAPDITIVGNVDIVLESDNGARVSLEQAFEYRERGVITELNPRFGQNGTFVNISGSNLFGHADNISEVTFGGILADIDFTATTNAQIRVRIQSNDVTSNVSVPVVITATTMARVSSTGNDWTYLVPGSVSNVQPDIGQNGTTVTINGTNLLGGGTSVQSILLDGVTATVTEATSASITVTMNDLSEQTDFYLNVVRIVADTGAVVTGGTYTHQVSGIITDINPRMGREGTRITITGDNLTGYGDTIDEVLISGFQGMIIDQISGSTVVIEAGAAPSGTEGSILLTSNTGAIVTSPANLTFTYTSEGNISDVSPPEGAEGSGVLIQGTDLRPSGTVITGVTIGGSPVSRIVTESDTEVSVIVGPAPENGGINATIIITANDGSIVRGGNFTYLDLAVSLPDLDQGQLGTQVRVSLPNDEAFRPSLTLVAKIGEQTAETIASSVPNGTIDVSTPRAGQVGTYKTDVTVEGIDGRVARLRNGFMYIEEGVIFFVTPNSGQQGTRIQLVGQNLLGGGNSIVTARVGERGGLETNAVVTNSSNSTVNIEIMNNLPAGSSYPLLGDITLVANTGATIIHIGGFTLVQPGEISSVTPMQGQFGTVVTIVGSNLLNGGTREDISSVTLSEKDVLEILDVPSPPSDSQVTVRANTSTEGEPGQVIITLMTGVRIITPEFVTFQYLAPGRIDVLEPDRGTVGTRVIISGANLLSGGSVEEVTLGGTRAEILSTPTNTVIEVRAREPAVGSGGGNNGSGVVEIVIDTGAIIRGGSWDFEDLGAITEISPTVGQQGVTVTARGTSLLGSSANSFSSCSVAGITGTVTLSGNVMARCAVGFNPSAGINTDPNRLSGPLELTADSGPVITSIDEFSYYIAYIEEIDPTNGTNGTYVTITGRNLIGSEESGNFDVATVTFGGLSTLISSTTVLSRDSIRVRVNHSPEVRENSNVRLQLTSEAFLVLENAWDYTEPGELVSISPETALPGEEVSISGTNLIPPCVSEATVIVGQTKSYEATVVNSSELTFRPGPYQAAVEDTSKNLDAPGNRVPIQVIASNGATLYSDTVLFEYAESTARVTDITPRAGSEGTEVTITGTNLLSNGTSAVNVTLAGRVATVVNATDSEVIVTAGKGSAEGSRGRVIIEADNGQVSGIGTDVWLYLPTITAADVSPQIGQDGTTVSIDLKGIPLTISQVYLTGTAAQIIGFDGDRVNIEAMPSLQTLLGDIRVEFADSIELTIPNAWTYLPPTMVTSLAPERGYYNTLITIQGSNFQAGGRLVESVQVAGISTDLVSQDDRNLVVRVSEFRDSSAGAIEGPVTITSEDGATFVSSGIIFTYVRLQVDRVTPQSGQGGTVVTITGVGLLAGSSASQPLQEFQLGGVDVQGVLTNTDTQIQVVASPSSNEGNVRNITYTVVGDGFVVIPDTWSYLEPGLVANITPSQGAQGSYVTIRGENMLQGGMTVDEVTVAGVPAMEIVVGFSDFIQVRLGESSDLPPERVSIKSDTGARLDSTLTFQYTASGNISSISPQQGQNGTRITLNGSEFTSFGAVSRVTLAGVEATVIGEVTNTSITVEAGRPEIFEEFSGQVIITAESGTIITGNETFAYRQEGVIYTAVPPQGQVGTRVIISGEGLFGGGAGLEAVYLAGVEAVINETTSSDSSISVTASAAYSAPLTGDIVLIANTGAYVRKTDGWSYVQPGSIANIFPVHGQFGTRIQITGARLLSGGISIASVIIGSVPAYEVLSSSDTLVEARVGRPVQMEGFTNNVTLVSNFGGELMSNFTWTYLSPSMVFDVFPFNGTGGDNVTVRGINLLGGGTRIVRVTTALVKAIRIEGSNNNVVAFIVGFHPTGAAIQGDIVIESDTGALTIIEDRWSYDRACSEGEFGTVGNCTPCNDECTVCTGPTDEDCLVCENFMIRLANSSMRCVNKCPSVSTQSYVCVDECDSNQFSRINTTQNASFCYDCHSLCDDQLGCTGPEATECAGCEVARDVVTQACVSSCRNGTWMNELRECIPCDAQCVEETGCFGNTSAHCYECQNVRIAAALYDEAEGSTSSGQPMINDICLERCPTGFYEDGDRDCLLCDPECLGGCTGPTPFDCHECASASRPQASDTLCVPACNTDLPVNNLYLDNNGSCQACSRFCSLDEGCTGPTNSDCISCRTNMTTNLTLPRFGNACVLSCPNTTTSVSPTPSQFYYHNMVTGSCELCDTSCNNGCTGPAPEDCIQMEDETTDLFAAGPGTIGITVGIIVLTVIISLLVVFLGWYWAKGSRRNRYKLSDTQDTNVEMGDRYAPRPTESQLSSPPKKESSPTKGPINAGLEEAEFYTEMSSTTPIAPEVRERSPQHGPIVYVAEQQYNEVSRSMVADAGITTIENEDAELYCEAGSEAPDVPARPPKQVEEKPGARKKEKAAPVDRRGKPPPPTITPYEKKSERAPVPLPQPGPCKPEKQAKEPPPRPHEAEPEMYTEMTAGVQEVYVQPSVAPEEEYSEMSPIHQGIAPEEVYEDTVEMGRHDDAQSPQKMTDEKTPLIDDLYEDTDATISSPEYQKVKHSASAGMLPARAPELPTQLIPRKRSIPLPLTPLEKSLQPQSISEDVYESTETPEESLYEAISSTHGRLLPAEPPPETPQKGKTRMGGNQVPLPPRGRK